MSLELYEKIILKKSKLEWEILFRIWGWGKDTEKRPWSLF